MKLDIESMLSEFLERLENKTAEQLLAEIDKAREDSKDSYIFEPEHEPKEPEPNKGE